ncbi:phosphinothricin acetyltransferase [Psychrobacillus sp. OK028]|uniref:GNAT family N-acetyltransferase n=1 Tax=Psychrobacillus sp. OK028 TaxID=1884359 RepID=UPI00088674EC|nr:GNAT family N-acetyltransferase [Psychrobacillus sp. OK028]SDN10610.1 phosphinothricin acetyltransferase [Psychrobacillus sp. OK028]
MKQNITISKMISSDWDRVREIFIEGIQTANATFRTEAPNWEDWDQGHLNICRFVAKLDGEVVGWVALSPVSTMVAYSGVVEVSIYIASVAAGKGVGSQLLQQVIESSEQNKIWTIQALIFPENIASINLHKKFGFGVVGTRKQMGRLNGVWRDVVLLERRSDIVGVE